MTFKVGDRVKLICSFAYGTLGTVIGYPDWIKGGKNDGSVVYVRRDPAGPHDCLRYHESELELISNTKHHKHHDLFIAWAKGAKIQFRQPSLKEWHDTDRPMWDVEMDYRIKPEPKPDVVKEWGVAQVGITNALDPNVKFTFDGETGKLKAVELLSN
jgi:hypothetical protein